MSNTVTTAIDPILQLGSQGSKVKELQELLNQEFGARQQIAVDGIFGGNTERAVKLVQYRYFLTQDGIVGSKTWHVLRTRTLFEKPLLRRGSRGELVRRVQQVLKDSNFYKGVVDGDFGSRTEDAVKALQKDGSLVVDGVITNETWKALVEQARILTAN
jgi:peptidoglycan hydrolase-like protein with peptidoglycan-binding domain